jgi:hypothetical protein
VSDDAGPESDASDRAAEGLDHLQTAAREMIAAARAFLDVVEEMVDDRDAVSSVVEAVTSVAQGAVRAVRDARPGEGGQTDDPDDPFEGGVQHIRVS